MSATEQINAILRNIPQDINNREKQLSLIITPTGPVLSWVVCKEGPEERESLTEEQTKLEKKLGLID